MASTTRMPATVPATRGALPVAAMKSSDAGSSSSAGGFKLFAWLLIILNVLAVGGWLYFKFFKTQQALRTLDTNRRQLMNLNSDLTTLHSTVSVISTGKMSEVEDAGRLVGDLATKLGIRSKLDISPQTKQPFGKSSYVEKSVKVTFLNSLGYTFQDIILFLTALESANPTVQIKDMDFGKRQPPTIGSDQWQPRVATVRVLQLTTSGG
jgi:hypothetical protein